MTDHVKVHADGATTVVTLNRPDKGNLMTPDMFASVAAAIRQAAGDPAMKAVLLAGAGDDFCLGRDMAAAMGAGAPPVPYRMKRDAVEQFTEVMELIGETTIPVVCAVQGKAYGAGMAFAAAADVTFATETASFCLPEMGRGMPPMLAMGALVDRMPPKALMYMAYGADAVDAATARDYGIVSQVVADLGAACNGFLETVAGYGAMQSTTVKHFLRRARAMDQDGAIDFSANMLAVISASEGK